MSRIAVLGGHIIDPAQKFDQIADLYLAEGKIVACGPAPAGFTADQTIAAAGLIVCPGLIDIRARTREPGLEYKATIASETAAALCGGITRICCPPDTEPVIDNPAMAHMVQQRARLTGNAIIHPLGALTQELGSERISNMAALAAAGCVGVSNGLAAISNSLVMRRAMQYAQTCHLTVFLHSLDPWLAGNGCVHEGEVSTRLESQASADFPLMNT
ncbi:MAG TPA: dihydroorotase, partial [Gammaproteobacteria bacterium]|nr:dihydroorotase [Gammaproteobacteria bacterium]